MSSGAFDATVFLAAQDRDFETALGEIRAGRKHSHWMWYVFPQIAGIPELHGRMSSPTSKKYSLHGLRDAYAYLDNPVLRARYAGILSVAAGHITDGGGGYDAVTALFGSVDNSKFVSSLTLFETAAHGMAHPECERIVQIAAELFADGRLRRCGDTPKILASAGD